MKAAWVRPGGGLFPDQQKARDRGLEQFFWDSTDPGIDPKLNGGVNVLQLMRDAGWKVGTTRDPIWENYSKTPEQFGQQLSDDITRLGGDNKQHSVIADIEAHDAGYVLRALQAFRAKRPNRYLYWTMEPKQFGPAWITQELVDYLRTAPFTWVVPQLYRGRMEPVSERAVVDEVISRGLPAEKVLSYYGRWEEGLNGIVFDWYAA